MNQLTPFSALNELHRELGRMFDSNYGLSRDPVNYQSTNWTPQVDIRESDKDFTVMADVPGVSPEDVEVTLHNGVLTIKGERNVEKESEEENYRRRERIRGTFFRQFTLPESVDEEAIKARAVNGVLEITIPKAAKPAPVSISVEGE